MWLQNKNSESGVSSDSFFWHDSNSIMQHFLKRKIIQNLGKKGKWMAGIKEKCNQNYWDLKCHEIFQFKLINLINIQIYDMDSHLKSISSITDPRYEMTQYDSKLVTLIQLQRWQKKYEKF